MTDTIVLGGTTVRVVAARDEATLLEVTLLPGEGAGAHTHTLEDETVAVLEGSLVIEADERIELQPGEAVILPRGVRHAFANAGEVTTRAYFFCSPGGLERFFREVASAGTPDEAAAAARRAGLVF